MQEHCTLSLLFANPPGIRDPDISTARASGESRVKGGSYAEATSRTELDCDTSRYRKCIDSDCDREERNRLLAASFGLFQLGSWFVYSVTWIFYYCPSLFSNYYINCPIQPQRL